MNPECDRVIAILPFDLRIGRPQLNLPEHHKAVVENLAEKLRPGGRAVLHRDDRHTLYSAFAATSGCSNDESPSSPSSALASRGLR